MLKLRFLVLCSCLGHTTQYSCFPICFFAHIYFLILWNYTFISDGRTDEPSLGIERKCLVSKLVAMAENSIINRSEIIFQTEKYLLHLDFSSSTKQRNATKSKICWNERLKPEAVLISSSRWNWVKLLSWSISKVEGDLLSDFKVERQVLFLLLFFCFMSWKRVKLEFDFVSLVVGLWFVEMIGWMDG